MCVYIYIERERDIHPISLLTLSLLALLVSNFPANLLWTLEFHPFELRLCSSQTPLKSTMLVRGIGRSSICT